VRRARFITPARLEYLTEVEYYAQIDPELGLRFAEATEEAASRALAFPAAGSPFESATRRVFLKGFPFSLVYREEPDGIVVFALAPHAKSPGYWRTRVHDR